MKNVMKRAWEIYRTLVGDRIAKISAALKRAWAEKKNTSTKKTMTEAVTNFLNKLGYSVRCGNDKHHPVLTAEKEITVKYRDYKTKDEYYYLKQVKNSYNKENKTIGLIKKICVATSIYDMDEVGIENLSENEAFEYIRRECYVEGF